MDFAMQTDLLRATEYFTEQIEKVYVRYRNRIYPFSQRAYNPHGGKCYYLSTWALMGLGNDDWLVRGQIDLPGGPQRKPQKNYRHGWVVFSYLERHFVYDPCEKYVWPLEVWESTFNPHDITFWMTKQQVLSLALGSSNQKNAYQISDYIFQFKRTEKMALKNLDNVNNGYLRDTLGGAQLNYGYGDVYYFLAEDRSN